MVSKSNCVRRRLPKRQKVALEREGTETAQAWFVKSIFLSLSLFMTSQKEAKKKKTFQEHNLEAKNDQNHDLIWQKIVLVAELLNAENSLPNM